MNHRTFVLVPLIGIISYFILYLIAGFVYPGGSYVDKTAKGFSFLHNYWCDLLSEKTHNDERNTAQPIAISAMILLCASLVIFWYYLPILFAPRTKNPKTLRSTGISSMIISAFLFTNYHDAVINLAGGLGVFALLLTLMNLFYSKFYKLFAFGILCLLLCLFNYFIYETRIWLPLLAVAQKITFVLFLGWLGVIDFCIYQKMKKEAFLLSKRTPLERG